MKLTFDKDRVLTLRDHAVAAERHHSHYGDETGPGLWLVGDQGVYLMSNGDPGLRVEEGSTRSYVAYAHECNPHTLEFDEWWENKRASFGGDDGAEFIALKDIPENGDIEIHLTPSQIKIMT